MNGEESYFNDREANRYALTVHASASLPGRYNHNRVHSRAPRTRSMANDSLDAVSLGSEIGSRDLYLGRGTVGSARPAAVLSTRPSASTKAGSSHGGSEHFIVSRNSGSSSSCN